MILSSSIVGPATLRFRDRALKDATVLSNTNVIDVSQFMDSYFVEVLLEIIVATNSNVYLEVIVTLSRSNHVILESVRHDKIKTWAVIKHQINDSIVRALLK